MWCDVTWCDHVQDPLLLCCPVLIFADQLPSRERMPIRCQTAKSHSWDNGCHTLSSQSWLTKIINHRQPWSTVINHSYSRWLTIQWTRFSLVGKYHDWMIQNLFGKLVCKETVSKSMTPEVRHPPRWHSFSLGRTHQWLINSFVSYGGHVFANFNLKCEHKHAVSLPLHG